VSSVLQLSQLEKVDLKQAWPHEALNFTPWLAEPKNLEMLGKEVGLNLVLEAVEKAVDTFSADILAKDIATDRWVVIENQLEKTDHSHLGQVLTYAAGLDAHTFIWIARDFREPHRAAIDYLNKISSPEYNFFGVQVELYRIAESPVAPVFRLVAKPNGWSKKMASDASGAQAISPQHIAWQEYWLGYIEFVSQQGAKVATQKPPGEGWCRIQQVVSGPTNAAVWAHKTSTSLRAVIWIQGLNADDLFAALFKMRSLIDSEVGMQLQWDPMEGKKSSMATVSVALTSSMSKQDEYAWLANHTLALVNKVKPFCEDAMATLNPDE
jgi:hypothetical protein